MPLKNEGNPIAKRGIENLLPTGVFEAHYCDTRELVDEYGGKGTKTVLNKKRLSNDVGSPLKFPAIPMNERFGKFAVIVQWIRELIPS